MLILGAACMSGMAALMQICIRLLGAASDVMNSVEIVVQQPHNIAINCAFGN